MTASIGVASLCAHLTTHLVGRFQLEFLENLLRLGLCCESHGDGKWCEAMFELMCKVTRG